MKYFESIQRGVKMALTSRANADYGPWPGTADPEYPELFNSAASSPGGPYGAPRRGR